MGLLTIKQAADYLQMNPQVVRRWLRAKKLTGIRLGREWRLDEKDLLEFIEAAKVKER